MYLSTCSPSTTQMYFEKKMLLINTKDIETDTTVDAPISKKPAIWRINPFSKWLK